MVIKKEKIAYPPERWSKNSSKKKHAAIFPKIGEAKKAHPNIFCS